MISQSQRKIKVLKRIYFEYKTGWIEKDSYLTYYGGNFRIWFYKSWEKNKTFLWKKLESDCQNSGTIF